MSNERAHALVLAETLMSISNGRLPESESIFAAAATELQTQHFRIKELEAMLDSVGAGGVSAQRIRQESDHIAQDLKTVAAPVCETDAQEPVAWRYQTSTGWHATTDASAALRVSKHHAIEPLYTAPQPQAALPVQAVEKSATHGMNLHQRILHVGGRENAQTYIEFGSVAAVRALVTQVLRDWPDGARGFAMPAPQPQADARDAQRYRWLIDYLVSDRDDLDDAIVAARTSEALSRVIAAAYAAEKGMK